MLKAEIICVGNELLNGKTVDTNSSLIGRKLAKIGVTVRHKSTVGDNINEIAQAVEQSWNRSSIILVTGGLGPTKDDITKAGVTKALGLKMAFYPQVESSINRFFKKLHRETPPSCLNQAVLPEGSMPLTNSWGTAPGIYLKREGKRLFLLPGVPNESVNILTFRVLPLLSRELGINKRPAFEINICGIGESKIQEALEGFSLPPEMEISYLPHMGNVKLVLSGNVEKSMLLSCSRKIQRLFNDNVFSRGSISLEEALGRILKQKKYQLAVAESCTGGLLASQMVNVAGASAYFLGGVIAYSNQAKIKFLGLSERLLEKHGAVSIPVAQAMAAGAAQNFSCQCGIAITGVAGPSGGTKEKPPGHVCIASYSGKAKKSAAFQFYGDRSMIRQQAVSNALFQMFSLLKNK